MQCGELVFPPHFGALKEYFSALATDTKLDKMLIYHVLG